MKDLIKFGNSPYMDYDGNIATEKEILQWTEHKNNINKSSKLESEKYEAKMKVFRENRKQALIEYWESELDVNEFFLDCYGDSWDEDDLCYFLATCVFDESDSIQALKRIKQFFPKEYEKVKIFFENGNHDT